MRPAEGAAGAEGGRSVNRVGRVLTELFEPAVAQAWKPLPALSDPGGRVVDVPPQASAAKPGSLSALTGPSGMVAGESPARRRQAAHETPLGSVSALSETAARPAGAREGSPAACLPGERRNTAAAVSLSASAASSVRSPSGRTVGHVPGPFRARSLLAVGGALLGVPLAFALAVIAEAVA